MRNFDPGPASPRGARGHVNILLLLLFSGLSSSVAAQDYSVFRTVFLPSVYHVGDRVELRLSLRSGVLNEIQPPQQLPQPDWGIIHDIRIIGRDDEKDIRIIFTSYYPGTQTVPPLNLGPIVLNDISIFVTPLLNQTELFAGRGPVVLPGTQIIIIFTVLFIFSLPLLWFPLIKLGRRYFLKLIKRHQEGLPYRNLEKNLKELANNAGIINGRNFYIQLLDLVRDYLNGRIQMDAKAATTGELEMALSKDVKDTTDRDFIIQLFHHGDLVKFASQPSTLKSRMDHLEHLREVLTHIESRQNKNREASRQPKVAKT